MTATTSIAEPLRPSDIYDTVVIATGHRKREVRNIAETLLQVMHQALSEDRDVHVPPLGRIRTITRQTDQGARVIYKLILQKDAKL